jgi:hypothetical protein
MDKNYVDVVAGMIAPLPKKCASIVMIWKASGHLENRRVLVCHALLKMHNPDRRFVTSIK